MKSLGRAYITSHNLHILWYNDLLIDECMAFMCALSASILIMSYSFICLFLNLFDYSLNEYACIFLN